MESAPDTLPARCREVFLLAKLHGLKYREIAEKLEVSEHGALLVTVAVIILSIIINCE